MLTLLYHNILHRPEDRWPLAYRAVTLSTFTRQIRRVRKSLLHPQQVHEALCKGQNPRGVLVTFDDGAFGLIEAGQILAEHGAVGVAFVCPGALSEGLWFYLLADGLVRAQTKVVCWQKLTLPVETPADKRQTFARLFDALFPLPASKRDAELKPLLAQLPCPENIPNPDLATLDEEGLHRAAATGGLVFANHTWSHPNITALAPQERQREIQSAAKWLSESNLPTLPWFAYPHGDHDAPSRQDVASICPVAFGATPDATMPNVLPRISLYDMDANPLRWTLKTALGGKLLGLRGKLVRGG